MDLTLTEDQRLISDTAAELLAARRATADAAAMTAGPLGHSTELWKELVELGWTGLPFAEEHGGVGLGFLELCLVLEQLGRYRVPTPLLSTVACAGMTIARFGTSAQRAEWLSAITAGRVVVPVLATPRGHWGASGSTVTARTPDDGVVLNGTATLVPYAEAADALLVVAEAANGPTVALVDAAYPGITRERLDTVGDPRYRVTLDQVRVPADRLLDDPGAAGPVVTALDTYGAVASCAEMAGGAQGVLDMTVEYAGQRQQFGRPIGTFQAVQHQCADMAVDVLSARLMAYEAAWRLTADSDDGLTVPAAKAWVSEAYERVCAHGQQIHGAIGFTAEHRLHHYLRHATQAALDFGDADVHTGRLADALGA